MTIDGQKTHHSIADYVTGERNSVDKHEYRDGEILLMAGGTANHSLVIANFIRELGNRLKGKPCNVYDSNLRVRIPRTVLYTYPDLTVICGPRATDPNDPTAETIINPRLIVEVLSPTTEAYDRGEKFARYRLLDSMEEYVLVSLTMPRVETFYRAAMSAASSDAATERTWLISTTSDLAGEIQLRSPGISLSLRDIYSGLEFPEHLEPKS